MLILKITPITPFISGEHFPQHDCKNCSKKLSTFICQAQVGRSEVFFTMLYVRSYGHSGLFAVQYVYVHSTVNK